MVNQKVEPLPCRLSTKSPKVEYSLTELGWRLEPALRLMRMWGDWYSEQTGIEYDDWLAGLGGRWKLWIWYNLFSGTKRFCELQKLAAPGKPTDTHDPVTRTRTDGSATPTSL